MSDDVLTEVEAAELLGVDPRTLAKMRANGRAPKHWGIGDKGVRYARADVLAWRDAGGTAQYGDKPGGAS